MAVWRDLEQSAPELAGLGLAQLNATGVALLGTLRQDGSPRISPIEAYVVDGQLLIGAMTWSKKTDDLRRDPRYVLHSAVTGPDTGESEFKLYGSAVEVGDEFRAARVGAWWSAWQADKAVVFSLLVGQAVLIDWDIENGRMTVRRWSPHGGQDHFSRDHP